MTRGLAAGRLDAFWLTKLFGLALVYFGYQFAFRPLPKPPAAATGATATACAERSLPSVRHCSRNVSTRSRL